MKSGRSEYRLGCFLLIFAVLIYFLLNYKRDRPTPEIQQYKYEKATNFLSVTPKRVTLLHVAFILESIWVQR